MEVGVDKGVKSVKVDLIVRFCIVEIFVWRVISDEISKVVFRVVGY